MGNQESQPEALSLVQSALSGEKEAIESFLEANPEKINIQDPQGNHMLGAACCAGHIHIVELLLEKGADKELKNDIG